MDLKSSSFIGGASTFFTLPLVSEKLQQRSVIPDENASGIKISPAPTGVSTRRQRHTHLILLLLASQRVIVNIDLRQEINGTILDQLSWLLLFVFNPLVQLEWN